MTRFTLNAVVALALWAACLSGDALADPAAAAPPAPPARTTHFKVRLLGDVDASASAVKFHIVTDTEIAYAWAVRGAERALILDSMRVEAKDGERPGTNVSMSAKRLVEVTDGKTTETAAADAPAALREVLTTTFGPPVAKITVDANGREVADGRTIIATGPAKAVAQGSIANALLMHPPYFADRKTWEAPAVVMIDDTETAQGTLTYTRVADQKGLPTFAVTGTAVRDQVAKPGSPVVRKNVKEAITGTQSYDPAIREWVSGAWAIDLSLDMFARDKPYGTVKGTIRVTFERVDPDR